MLGVIKGMLGVLDYSSYGYSRVVILYVGHTGSNRLLIQLHRLLKIIIEA